jgi:hypothetical protein
MKMAGAAVFAARQQPRRVLKCITMTIQESQSPKLLFAHLSLNDLTCLLFFSRAMWVICVPQPARSKVAYVQLTCYTFDTMHESVYYCAGTILLPATVSCGSALLPAHLSYMKRDTPYSGTQKRENSLQVALTACVGLQHMSTS